MKRLITADLVEATLAAGQRCLSAPFAQAIVTPLAWSKAAALGVTISQDESFSSTHVPPPDKGSAERIVDASGITLIRGQSVRLGVFDGAGPGRQVGLTDVVTKRDGSPMGAGIMSWGRDDSFAWTLGYDEIDLVLEGNLQIRVAGRALQGRAGDIFYIPKGSSIVFATPDRVRLFYVTHPADWSAAG